MVPEVSRQLASARGWYASRATSQDQAVTLITCGPPDVEKSPGQHDKKNKKTPGKLKKSTSHGRENMKSRRTRNNACTTTLQKISSRTLDVSSSVLTTRPNATPSLAVGGSKSATNPRTIPGTDADGGSVGWSVRWLIREMQVDTGDANRTVPTDAPAERAVSVCGHSRVPWEEP